MIEYREKKKDLIQMGNNEYYKSNEYKIKNSKRVNYCYVAPYPRILQTSQDNGRLLDSFNNYT